MTNYKQLIKFYQKQFLGLICLSFIILLVLLYLCIFKLIIFYLIFIIPIGIKEYIFTKKIKKISLKNKTIIDEELKNKIFEGRNYILTNNFIFDLEHYNVINYKNICAIKKCMS